MNELERTGNNADLHPSTKSSQLSSLEVYDKYGAIAYGIILQIVPQPHLAQEILVNVFSSPLLQNCNSYPFTFAVCVIKLARSKAVEAKRKIMSIAPVALESGFHHADQSPQRIFNLAFCEGYTPDEVAEKLNISKSDVLKAFHDFFKASRNS